MCGVCVGTRQQILTANGGVGPSPGYLLPAHRAATLWCGHHPSPNPWWQPRDQSRKYKHVNGGQIFVTEVTKFLLLHIIFVNFRKRFFENLAVIIYPSSHLPYTHCTLPLTGNMFPGHLSLPLSIHPFVVFIDQFFVIYSWYGGWEVIICFKNNSRKSPLWLYRLSLSQWSGSLQSQHN